MAPAKYPYGVCIGRAQPPTLAHLASLRQGLQVAERIAVLIDGSRLAPSTRNPFSFEQRVALFSAGLGEGERGRLRFFPLRDHPYAVARWQAEVRHCLAEFTADDPGPDPAVVLLGLEPDPSGHDLEGLPRLARVDTGWEAAADRSVAARLRAGFLEGGRGFRNQVAEGAGAWLERFMATPAFADLAREQDFIRTFKDSWKGSPYPPTFNTADALVVAAGQVLLVQRGGFPGHGLLALPGGYLNPGETLLECALRELGEETGLAVEVRELRAGVVAQHTFDHPERSDRGRIITQAFAIRLETGGRLPGMCAQGGDDAQGALWMPLDECERRPERFFEDHLAILETFRDRLEA
ncbi:MAG: NUDIX domain-containing protein [Holophaga sp.]|nr:NUDIX domain-containing protein [Holophaga sp.]